MQTAANEKDLRYPIGRFEKANFANLEENIETIRNLPERLRQAINGLTPEQLDLPYRPGGWSLRQTIHHLADSHLQSFGRIKTAITSSSPPVICPYDEAKFAELADYDSDIEPSLQILEGLHLRWVRLLESLNDEQHEKKFRHPETGDWTIREVIGLYAWHSLHHTAHITEARRLGGF
jgi:uncharacterized damage-inducible protein DinB